MSNAELPDIGVLRDDPTEAIQQIIFVAENLLLVMDFEAGAMAKQNTDAFSQLLSHKDTLSDSYGRLARSFRERLEEFKDVDKVYIEHLERLQKDLKARAEGTAKNMDILTGSAGGV